MLTPSNAAIVNQQRIDTATQLVDSTLNMLAPDCNLQRIDILCVNKRIIFRYYFIQPTQMYNLCVCACLKAVWLHICGIICISLSVTNQ